MSDGLEPKKKIYSGQGPALDFVESLFLPGLPAQPDKTRGVIDTRKVGPDLLQQRGFEAPTSYAPAGSSGHEIYKDLAQDVPENLAKSLTQMSPAYQQWNADAESFIMDTQGETEPANIDAIRDLKLLIMERSPQMFADIKEAYDDKVPLAGGDDASSLVMTPSYDISTLAGLQNWHSKHLDEIPNITNWETAFRLANLFPNALANYHYKANPEHFKDKRYGVTDAREADEQVDFWTSKEGLAAIGLVLGSSLLGGWLGGTPGSMVGGSVVPAVVGEAIGILSGDFPMPFSEGTDYELGHFMEGLEAGMGTGPRWKTMDSQSLAQIIGSDRGNMAALYEMTAFDLPAEIVGMGAGFGIGKLWGKYTTRKIASSFKNVGRDSRGDLVGGRTWRQGDPIYPNSGPINAHRGRTQGLHVGGHDVASSPVTPSLIRDEMFGRTLYPIIKKRERMIRGLHSGMGSAAAKQRHPKLESKVEPIWSVPGLELNYNPGDRFPPHENIGDGSLEGLWKRHRLEKTPVATPNLETIKKVSKKVSAQLKKTKTKPLTRRQKEFNAYYAKIQGMVDAQDEVVATMLDGSKSTIYPIPENQPLPLAESTVDFILRNADREVLEPNSEVIEAIARTPVRQPTVDGKWVEAPQQLSAQAMEQVKKERAGQRKVVPPPMDGYIDAVRFYLAKKFGPNSVIWEQLVSPTIYGIGRQGRDGLVAMERNRAAAGKLIYAVAKEAGLGTFSQPSTRVGKALVKGKRAVTDNVMPFDLVFKGAKNEENARSIIDAVQTSDEAMEALPEGQRKFAFLAKNMFDSMLEMINLKRLEAYGPDAKLVEVKGRENYFPHMFTLSYFDGVTHDLAKMSNEEIDFLNSFMTRQTETPYKYNPEGADRATQELDWLKSLDAPQDLIDKGAFKNHFFPEEMMGFGNLLPRETSMDNYSRDILAVMDKYITGAEQVINMAVPAARFDAGLEQLKLTNSIDDDTYRYLRAWSDETLHNRGSEADKRFLPGQPGATNALFRGIQKLVNKSSVNLIPGSLTFMGQNFLSFPNLYMVQGIKATDILSGAAKSLWYDATPALKRAVGNISDKEILDGVNGAFGRYGIHRYINEFSLGSALRESQVMQQRFDTGWERSAEEALKSGKWYKVAVGVIDAADTYMVAMAYHTGKRAAYRQYGQMRMAVEDGAMELPYFIKARYGEPPVAEGMGSNADEWWDNTIERLSRAYGDDLAGDTQAVYHKMMQAPLQRRAAFKTIAPFQTWVTQAASLARDTFVGRGATGASRVATWNKYTPSMKLSTGIKLYGAMVAANSLARVTGLRPPYNPETFIPGGENVIAAFDITASPNRGSSMMVTNNMRRIMAAIGSIAEKGFDYEDVSQRQGLEASLIQFPKGMGLQLYNRLALNLVDRGRGGINIGQGGGKASWLPLGGTQNRRMGGDVLGTIGQGVENIGEAIYTDPLGTLEGLGLGTKNMRKVRGKKSKFREPGAEVFDTFFPSYNPFPVKGEAPVWGGHMQGMLERLGLDKDSMKDYGDK